MESVDPGATADRLRPLRVAIAKHAHTPSGGAEDYLFMYLEPRIATCAMLAHPFPDARGVPPQSRWRVHDREAGATDTMGWRGYGPLAVYHLRDVAETLRRFLFTRQRWDVFVGVDNLNATMGIMLRWVGRVRSVVFYVIDYVPQRFENRFLNWLYHAFDRFAVRRADCTWNVNALMADARAEQGLPLSACGPQLVVPVGAPAQADHVSQTPEPTVVYMGHLVHEQGVDRLLYAWRLVVEAVPDAVLWIVGSGAEEHALREQATQMGMNDAVQWLGFVPDEDLPGLLGSAWVAVAPYPDVPGSYKHYADPGKLRWYCAAGLPIVVTDVPAAAAPLGDEGAATVVPPQAGALAAALVELLSDAAARGRMADAARRLGATYTWETIFAEAWAASWPHLEARWNRRR